jgi:hypothetical protein
LNTLQTNYKDAAKRYELAERSVWARTPNWKRAVIVKCKLTSRLDGERLLDEYAHEIMQLAEGETVLSDKLPPVPAFTLESEAAETAANPS